MRPHSVFPAWETKHPRRIHASLLALAGSFLPPLRPFARWTLQGLSLLHQATPWLRRRWLPVLGAVLLLLGFAGFLASRPLPPPTPGKHPLVVVTHAGPLSHDTQSESQTTGFDHDLVREFAARQGLDVEFVVVPIQEIPTYLARGKAHLAAGWLTPSENSALKSSSPYMATEDIIVQNEAALPVDQLGKLRGRLIHVIPGSRQAAHLEQITETLAGTEIKGFSKGEELQLLEAVSKGDIELALIDRALLKIALNYYPNLQTGVVLGKAYPITWLFPATAPRKLLEDSEAFLKQARQEGLIKRLEDRYLGHVTRLTQADVVRFITSIETLLPKYRKLFQAAQTTTGLDWRLIAAVAYQESLWDPLATSPTGVRGMMMLTEETADRLGVKNRLDPREAIPAGARYLSYLRTAITATAPDPDSYWLALAAYNIGPGHFNAAKRIARQLKKNPDSWYEMKSVLPLLAQPQYYENLISGRARGGEAIIMAENVRMFYGILSHHEAPLLEGNKMMGMIGMTGMGGMTASPTPQLKPPTNGSSPGLKPQQGPGLKSSNGPGLKLD